MVKAIMHGCNGRMGQVVSELVKADDGIEFVAGVDSYTGRADDYPVFESIEKCDVDADVIIDFSGGLFGCFIDWLLCRFKNKKKNKNSSSGIVAK